MIGVSASANGMLVTVTGELDLSAREEAEAVQRRIAVRERPHLTLDLCRMSFMDSAGAAWIASMVEQDRRMGGHPLVRGASPRDLFVLEVCGVLDRVDVDPDHHCQTGRRSSASA